MIQDAKLVFSTAQSIVQNSGVSVASTDVVDLGAVGDDAWKNDENVNIGEGGEIELNVHVTTTLTGASAATVVTLQMDSVEGFSSAATVLTFTIPALTAAGTKYSRKIPAGLIERYLRCYYTASGGNVGAGAVSAWLGLEHQT